MTNSSVAAPPTSTPKLASTANVAAPPTSTPKLASVATANVAADSPPHMAALPTPPPFYPGGRRLRTHWEIPAHARKSWGAAVAHAVAGYADADLAKKMQIWMSFIALPTARLIINNREHGGKHLRARLAKRQDMTDIIGDAWKETIVSAEREAEDANR